MGSCFSLPMFIQNTSDFKQRCYTTHAPYHLPSRTSPTTVAEMHEYYDL